MAIVTLSITDSAPVPHRWSTPATAGQINSPIPLGLIIFNGTNAIEAKQAGDETSIILTLTMPQGYAYLLKSLMVRIRSDDLVNEFEVNALGRYTQAIPDTLESCFFNLTSPGNVSNQAANAMKIYNPAALTPKLMLLPADLLALRFADVDAGATTAGDISWYLEQYVFAIDQVDKWPVNAPQPVISHTNF